MRTAIESSVGIISANNHWLNNFKTTMHESELRFH